MIVLAGFDFEAKLTLDGIMTLAAGLIAYVAAVRQIRHADRGLKQELQDDKGVRARERHRRNKATATAILFEVDRFYSVYIGGFLKILTEAAAENRHPQIESPGKSPFLVYSANCERIGELDKELVQTIVDFYARAQRHAQRVEDYVCTYAAALADPAGGVGKASRVDRDLLPGIKSACEKIVDRAYIVCAYLCEYAGIVFKPGEFETAKLAAEPTTMGPSMSQAERENAQTAVENFRARMKRGEAD